MNVLKLAAFSRNGKGGNPAGVAFCDEMPSDEEMKIWVCLAIW
jgi:predicted PhzF superfamily epimerase YddE/YHI9